MPRGDLILVRRGSAADWSAINPILAAGEKGFETDTRREKTGNGSSDWNSLGYDEAEPSTMTQVAYTTAIPLDSLVGKRMAGNSGPVHLVTSAESFTLGASPLLDGYCEVIVQGAGGSLTFPTAWSRIGNAPDMTLGKRSLLAFTYTDTSEVVYSVTPLADAVSQAPNAPTGLSHGIVGQSTVSYTWTAPATDSTHDAAATYQLQTRQPAGAGSFVNNGAPVAIPSATATGLTASTTVDARVQAINTGGSSGYSNTDTTTTASPASQAAPDIVWVANANPNHVVMQFTGATMNQTSVPDVSAFAVSGHTVSSVNWFSSTILYLVVTANFTNGEAARTLTYTSAGALKNTSGGVVGDFGPVAIDNQVAAAVGAGALTQTAPSISNFDTTTDAPIAAMFVRQAAGQNLRFPVAETAIPWPSATNASVGTGSGTWPTISGSAWEGQSGYSGSFSSADASQYVASAAGAWGVSFTLPASTTARTLRVHFGGTRNDDFSCPGRCKLTAVLSDGSAGPLTITTAAPSGNLVTVTERHDIVFSSATNGQTLTLTFEAAAGNTTADIIVLQLLALS